MSFYQEIALNAPHASAEAQLMVDSTMSDRFILIHVSPDYFNFLSSHGFFSGSKNFIVFFPAIYENYAATHHKDVFRIANLRFYTNNPMVAMRYEIEEEECIVSKSSMLRVKNEQAEKAAEAFSAASFSV
jgi:hypothetical protein